MTGDSVSPRNEKISVKCKSIPLHGAFFEVVDFNYTDVPPSGDEKCTISNSNPQSSKVLSTSDLISAVGYAWRYAGKPLSVLLSKTNSTGKSDVSQEAGIVHYSIKEGTYLASTSAVDEPCSRCYFSNKENFVELVEENQEHSGVNQKASFLRPSYVTSFWGIVLSRSTGIEGSSLENCLLSAGIPSNLGSIYGWMSKITPDRPKNQVNSIQIESKRTTNYYTSYCSTNTDSGCAPSNKTSTFNSLTTGISTSEPEPAETLDLSFGSASNFDLTPPTAACSENDNVHDVHIEATDCEISTSGCDGGSQESNLASLIYVHEDSIKESRNALYEDQEDQGTTFVKTDSSNVDLGPSVEKKNPLYALAKQEHAFAGAMAGVFVSISLHPIDTIKTVLQSCRSDQRSLHYIGRCIIAERGLSGLYRGIFTNIISSAPISALYTFTYESVKKSLLPLLPKEYHSLALCTAGGCASIATSFLFTPSERIKQQMQVGSHYRNCWSALIQVIQKGGVPSLYAGWGAVLCRNVPHSVIKFYTYESLKQIMLPSTQWSAQANLLVTLVCGGLAGSTAALFTTPFDVVKTRLQTQTPGSVTKYSGVLSTLNEIRKYEGLNGLYRGLTPRLVMYMIQGALFFASYESFKRLFSLELSSQTIRHDQKNESESTVLPPTVSVTA